MVLHRMVNVGKRSIYTQPTMERSSTGSYLVSAEGPPFLALGPMDKNAQLHWTFGGDPQSSTIPLSVRAGGSLFSNAVWFMTIVSHPHAQITDSSADAIEYLRRP